MVRKLGIYIIYYIYITERFHEKQLDYYVLLFDCYVDCIVYIIKLFRDAINYTTMVNHTTNSNLTNPDNHTMVANATTVTVRNH